SLCEFSCDLPLISERYTVSSSFTKTFLRFITIFLSSPVKLLISLYFSNRVHTTLKREYKSNKNPKKLLLLTVISFTIKVPKEINNIIKFIIKLIPLFLFKKNRYL